MRQSPNPRPRQLQIYRYRELVSYAHVVVRLSTPLAAVNQREGQSR